MTTPQLPHQSIVRSLIAVSTLAIVAFPIPAIAAARLTEADLLGGTPTASERFFADGRDRFEQEIGRW
jgi:hypothetical protein